MLSLVCIQIFKNNLKKWVKHKTENLYIYIYIDWLTSIDWFTTERERDPLSSQSKKQIHTVPPWLQDWRWAARVRPRLTLTCAPTTPAVRWTRPSTAISARAAALPRRTARAPRPAVSTTANPHWIFYHSQPPCTGLPQPTFMHWFTTANLHWLVYHSQPSCTGLPQPTSIHWFTTASLHALV